MPDLFGGTYSFVPVFEGQKLAIAAGQAAGQAFTSGMGAGTSRMNAQTNQQELQFAKQKYQDQISRLGAMRSFLDDGMP